MKGAARIGCFALAIGLFASLSVEAQPRGGGRGGGGRGGRGRMMAARFVPVEQTLGFLAFDKKIGLADDQLLKVRNELKTVHKKRAELMEGMQGGEGDREAMMEQVRALRGEMLDKLTSLLTAEQNKTLDEYMERMRNFGGRGGRRGGGERQRGGGGERM